MRAVIQKVTSAAVEVDGAVVSSIGPGLLCLVGLAKGDSKAEIEALARRILRLRAFSKGDNGSGAAGAAEGASASDAAPWTASVCGVGGEVLLVSQFTLHARTHRRSRPDFSRAMAPGEASGRWREFVEFTRREALREGARGVSDGAFGQMMHVRIHNDGPVTFILDTDAEAAAAGGGASEGAGATGGTATMTSAGATETEGGGGEGGGLSSGGGRRVATDARE